MTIAKANNRRIEGWLFDVDEGDSSIGLWIYDWERKLHRLTHEFSPPIYVSGPREDLKRLSADFYRRGFVTGGRWGVKREFWSGQEIEVLRLNVSGSSSLPRIREIAGALDQTLSFYNLDLPTSQYYLYMTGLFPLCRLKCDADAAGNVIEMHERTGEFKSRKAPWRFLVSSSGPNGLRCLGKSPSFMTPAS